MRILLLAITVLFICSCSKENKCIKSLGKRHTEIRTPGNYNEVSVSDKINITLQPSAVNEVVVEGGENMVPFIETRVENGKLIIEDLNKCNFLRSYKKNELNVTVRYTNLQKVFLESSGEVTCTDTMKFSTFFLEARSSSGDIDLKVKGDTLKIVMHTGTSNVHITGRSYKTEIYSGGNGIFHLEDLVSEYVLSNNSGTGDFYVQALTYLFAHVHLIGNIYYKGNPSIDYQIDDKGKLIQL